MASAVKSELNYNYHQWPGPYCIEHKSTLCAHALAEINARRDVEPLTIFLGNAPAGSTISLMVPLWTEYFMWEDLKFVLKQSSAMGPHGELIDRGSTHSTRYDLGVRTLLRGESARDLSRTMVQQFDDIMAVDMPNKLPGCKSPVHGMRYQAAIERLVRESGRSEAAASQLMPHLYGLLGRQKPICAFCWGDSYGGDAKRVSDNPEVAAQADDMSDLLFEG